jgi:hypothetical protein
MVDGVNSLQTFLHDLGVTDVAVDEFDFRSEIIGTTASIAVDLGGKGIENPDFVTVRKKFVSEM